VGGREGRSAPVTLQSYYATRTREVRTVYGSHEVDAVGVYSGELDRSYLLPISLVEGQRAIQLRLAPPQNGQRPALHWAADYELPGAIAQLGERLHGMQEVAGSSPASSTRDGAAPTVIGAHELRNRLGWYFERAAGGEDIRVTRRGRPFIRLSPERAGTASSGANAVTPGPPP
jgi:prevent-host-death family protein